MWKKLYGQSARDHGSLGFFRSLLNRNTVTADVKKAVDDTLDFFEAVTKGHFLAAACRILGINSLNDKVQLPDGILKADTNQQLRYIHHVATKVVQQCTVIDTNIDISDTSDRVYNYARVLCHYGALILEFRDAVSEGDGERVYRCWRVMLPHFLASRRTKYSLEALRLQFQVKALLPPYLAHQVLWHRFVNTRGGPGRNIQCDLHNEHINKLIKGTIVSMGANLTEKSLQRAARSVSTVHAVCKQFDNESGVPVPTSAHSTREDKTDVGKVVCAVLTNKLLEQVPDRSHSKYGSIHLNPLHNWDKKKAIEWIKRKQRDYMKFRTIECDAVSEDESGDESNEH